MPFFIVSITKNKHNRSRTTMSFNAFNTFNAPFWDFFDNINDEVDQFNKLIQNSGLDNRVRASPSNNKAVTQNGENTSDGQVSKISDIGRGFGFPSVFSSSFLNGNFDVVPPVDVLDNEKEYELHVSIPGAKKEDVKLDFHPEKNEVVISGVIGGHTEEASKNLKLQERRSGKFERRITLPASSKVDEENIKANYTNGVLTLKVPKLENSSPTSRRIEISSSESWESGAEEANEKATEKAA